MVVRYPRTTLPRLVLTVLAAGVVTGIEGDLRATVTALLKQHQPKAVAFNGCVVKGGAEQNKSTCITPNALRWIGSHPASATFKSCSLKRREREDDSSCAQEPRLAWRRTRTGLRATIRAAIPSRTCSTQASPTLHSRTYSLHLSLLRSGFSLNARIRSLSGRSVVLRREGRDPHPR